MKYYAVLVAFAVTIPMYMVIIGLPAIGIRAVLGWPLITDTFTLWMAWTSLMLHVAIVFGDTREMKKERKND